LLQQDAYKASANDKWGVDEGWLVDADWLQALPVTTAKEPTSLILFKTHAA
jgi:hypothetical protein